MTLSQPAPLPLAPTHLQALAAVRWLPPEGAKDLERSSGWLLPVVATVGVHLVLFWASLRPAPPVEPPQAKSVLVSIAPAPRAPPEQRVTPPVARPVPPAPRATRPRPPQVAQAPKPDVNVPVLPPPTPTIEAPHSASIEPDPQATPAIIAALPEPLPKPVSPTPPTPEVKPADAVEFSPAALATRVDIDYRARSSFVDGVGSYRFERDGERYSIRGELAAEGFFADAFVGKMVQAIAGRIDASGLQPEMIASAMGNQGEETATIDWGRRQLTYNRSGQSRSEAMEGAANDVISLLFSFAAAAPTVGREVNIVTPRGQNRYAMEVVGTEVLELRIGKVETVHVRLTHPRNRQQYEAWLAKDYRNLPVKMRFPAAQGRVVFDMVATRVKIEG
jgi:hypothetical protein